jgi:hypothetical protein
MTHERIPEADQELGAEELALVLASPRTREASGITDPIALCCPETLDLERPITTFRLAQAPRFAQPLSRRSGEPGASSAG